MPASPKPGSSPPPLSLPPSLETGIHDLLALGEYSKALKKVKSSSGNNSNNKSVKDNGDDEILRRLPCLLRLLISSQPLSSVPNVIKDTIQQRQQQEGGDTNNTDTATRNQDPYVQREQQEEEEEEYKKNQQQKNVDAIVSLLEAIAVAHPESENMELLISHLLPKVINGGRLLTRNSGNYNETKTTSATGNMGTTSTLATTSTSTPNNKNLKNVLSSLSRRRNQLMKLSLSFNESENNSDSTLYSSSATRGGNVVSTAALNPTIRSISNQSRADSKNITTPTTTITVEDEDEDDATQRQQQQSSTSLAKSHTTILNSNGKSYCYYNLAQKNGASNQRKEVDIPRSQYHYYVSSNWDTNYLQCIMDDYYDNMKLKRNHYNVPTFNKKRKNSNRSNSDINNKNHDKNSNGQGGDKDQDGSSAEPKHNKRQEESSSEDDDNNDDDNHESSEPQRKKMKLSPSSSSSPISAAVADPTSTTTTKEEDSQEYNIMKILIELIGLIIVSLQPLQLKIHTSSPIRNEAMSNNDTSQNVASMITPSAKLSHSTLSDTVKDEDDVEGGVGSSGGGGPPTTSTSSNYNPTNGVALQINPDSMLTETINNSGHGSGSTINANVNNRKDSILTIMYAHSNLSALLTSLLHHAPILRYEHISNALCRATTTTSSPSSSSPGSASVVSISQCSHIIQRLAANSPSSSCTLVKGCINAYHYARLLLLSSSSKQKSQGFDTTSGDHAAAAVTNNANKSNNATNIVAVQASAKTIIQSAKESVLSIAKLSKRELSHIITTLNHSCAMPDVMILLMMELDGEDITLSMLLEDLKRERSQMNTTIVNKTTDCDTNSNLTTEISISYRNKKRRRYNMQNRKRKQCTISNVVKKVQYNNPWVINELKNDAILASKVRKFVSLQLKSIINNTSSDTITATEKNTLGNVRSSVKNNSLGRISFILRVYAALIHSVGIGSGSSFGSGSTFVQHSMDNITLICKHYQEVEGTGGVDEVVQMSISACILTCIQFPPIADGKETCVKTPSLVACIECFKCQLKWNSVSEASQGFLSRILHLIRYQCGSGLKYFLLHNLFGATETQHSSSTPVDEKYFNFCQWANSIVENAEVRGTPNNIPQNVTPSNISSLIEGIRHSSTYGKEYDGVISRLLNDAEKCDVLFDSKGLVTLVNFAASTVPLRPPPIIPIVLPLSVESGVSRAVKNMSHGTLERKFCRQITLQLIYAFTFLDKMGGSPFAIKPRSLPLQTVMHLTSMEKSEGSQVIQNFVMKYSPETFNRCNDNLSLHLISNRGFRKYLQQKVLTAKDLGNVIRQRLSISEPYDSLAIEQLFLFVRATQPASIVDVEVSLVLLESTSDPVRFLTYTKLCQDPLMLMKCSLKVWTDEGLRRILLTILQRLLNTNEQIVKETSITTEVATEYLVSRDSVILRSWLLIFSSPEIRQKQMGYQKKFDINCPLLVSMIRSMIANRFGLVAAMMKQLDPTMLDWLVAHVPEIRSEGSIFLHLLERGILSAVERLHVADAALRIAIAHGSKDETELQPLAYTALSVLVNSFYIVLGPVGVPVNVIRDQNGEDTTHLCRKYLLRMLSAVKIIKEDTPKIRNESRIALSKLAGFCKNDMNFSGLTGAAAQRRKVIIKELWDALVRANTSLGSMDYVG